jgi:MSHA biogenesis protein MshI
MLPSEGGGLIMRWPWKREVSTDQLVVSWSAQTLAYVLARPKADGSHEVLKLGVERQGTDNTEVFVRRLQALGLKGLPAHIMLRPEQYQLLQIDAPAVAPDELRAAARYQIREMIPVHVDDVTLDVMRVGDVQQKGKGHLFVVVATNAMVREVLELGESMRWTVSVIDVQETAQRNLQNALATRDGMAERALAALLLLPGQQAVLTICANEELFYTRRFELPEGFLTASWGAGIQAPEVATDAFTPVDEYVPDYSGMTLLAPTVEKTAVANEEKAQRLLVEVQRSLDVWDRSWSSMPLAGLSVYAGERSQELAQWLGQQLGQTVLAMDVHALFAGFESGSQEDRSVCLPLLGVLLRSESRKL